MLTESVMRRLRRGDPVAQFTGNYRRSIWSPRRGAFPGSQFLFGPARGTYWLQDDEVHLLYEPLDKPIVHYAGPIPRKQMAPALVYLMLMWPIPVVAATLLVVLGSHLATGLTAYGYAILALPLLSLVLLLAGRAMLWRRRRIPKAAAASEPGAAGPAGRVIAPDVPLPESVRAAIATPPRAPGEALRLARRAARWTLLVSVLLLLLATFVLDPAATYDDDAWAQAALIVGVCGSALLGVSLLALVTLAIARHLNQASVGKREQQG